ncbi:MAG: hexose kinase [Methylobacter sp.]|nr:hexose kinase [Methylobacter sp.]
MAKIITITANTAIDLFIEVESLTVSDNILAKSSIDFACGKGINVAKAIESLDTPVSCLGFVGRQSLAVFDAIQTGLLRVDLIAVAGKTRTNITLLDSDSYKETHIRTTGFTVTDGDCRKLIEKINASAQPGDIIIVSGSLPAGAPENLYQTIIELCHSKAVLPFLDSSGAGLLSGIKTKPYLIKPNQQELEDMIGRILPNEQSLVDAARAIIDHGVQWVYVSRGDKGAIAVSEKIALAAYVNKMPGKIVSKIGCGDAMVAGLAVATLGDLDLSNTLKLGIACGTANLFSKEPGRFNKDKLSEITDHLVIRKI